MSQDDTTKPVYIYALVDPRTGEIRYVGKTYMPLNKRLSLHLSNVKRHEEKNHRYYWLHSLISVNLSPEIRLLETCSKEDWIEREQYWVARGKELGWNLTNTTIGGEGISGWHHSEETKQKMREKRGNKHPNYGRKASPETRAKLSEMRKGNKYALGYKYTEERKKSYSERMKGNTISKGQNVTEETRQRLSAASKGRKKSELTKYKMSQAQLGEKHPQAKLTGQDVRNIRMRLAEGENHQTIANDYGVSRATISAIHTKTTWKHMED